MIVGQKARTGSQVDPGKVPEWDPVQKFHLIRFQPLFVDFLGFFQILDDFPAFPLWLSPQFDSLFEDTQRLVGRELPVKVPGFRRDYPDIPGRIIQAVHLVRRFGRPCGRCIRWIQENIV